MLHFLECILIRDDQFVILYQEIVVLAGQLEDLIFDVETVGLIEEGVVVIVYLVDLWALCEVCPWSVHYE